MAYYHPEITEKSWAELCALKKRAEFVLIGGWAVYLYTRQLKSKDIDILVNFDQLGVLAKAYSLTKNDRLKKYEARKDEVQIDIYLPYYSNLGIETDFLIKHSKKLNGFNVLDIDYLAAIKLFTLTQRGRTPKGRKDFLDIISLLMSTEAHNGKIRKILQENGLDNSRKTFQEFLKESSSIPELSLNSHYFSKLKKNRLTQI